MIKTCFSPTYYADTYTASMRKLPLIAREVESLKISELHDPDTWISEKYICEKLKKLHNPEYFNCFINGIDPLASSQGWKWTEKIKNGVLSINKGQLKGAELALENKISANIAQGFHHSIYDKGMGFCTFNGLALVAQEYPDLNIGVLDCDEHFGNGTADFSERLPNLFNYSIFGSIYEPRFISHKARSEYLPNINGKFHLYIEAIERGLDFLTQSSVDLIIYQAGVDCHKDDPFGSTGLTTEDISCRDSFVFQSIKQLDIPLLFVMAGGYQEPIEEKLIPLHVNTFKNAFKIYY